MTRLFALALALTMAAGCAPARAGLTAGPPTPSAGDRALMASYVQALPLGSRVRVTLADGQVVRGTLMKNDADPIAVQKRTRLPEPPLRIAIADIRALEPEGKNGSTGRAVAIGAAAGAASALGVLLIIVALLAGD